MDVAKKCKVLGKHVFGFASGNRFLLVEVEGRYLDMVRVNELSGAGFNELLMAFELPRHEDHPVIDGQNKTVLLGGEERKTRRTVFVIGR